MMERIGRAASTALGACTIYAALDAVLHVPSAVMALLIGVLAGLGSFFFEKRA